MTKKEFTEMVYDLLLDHVIFDVFLEADAELRRPTLSLLDFYLYHKALDEKDLTSLMKDSQTELSRTDMQSHEIKSQGSSVCCPRCSHAIGGSRFATHLEKCMIGGKRGSRKHYDALDDNFFFHGRGSKGKADPHPDSLIIKLKLRKGVPWGNSSRLGASYEEFEAGVQTKSLISMDDNPTVDPASTCVAVTKNNSYVESVSGHTSNDGTGSSDSSFQDDLLKTEISRIIVRSKSTMINSTNINSFNSNSIDNNRSSSSSCGSNGYKRNCSSPKTISNGKEFRRVEDYVDPPNSALSMEGDGSNSAGRQLRPRKSVLTDISNKLSLGVSQITDATKKAVVGKKRKLSTNEADAESNKISKDSHSSNFENPLAAVQEHDNSVIDGSGNTTLLSSDSGSVRDVSQSSSVIVRRSKTSSNLPFRVQLHDPALCLDIIDDMYDIYFQKQEKYCTHPYMAIQNDINYKMRSILIDWLVEVHFKFKLIPSTLWLCVNLLDRYLTKVVIKRAKLQLIGVTALFISCKFEEIFPPEVRDCVYITDFAYEREEVLQTETHMLGELNYEIFVPTGYHFMTRYLNTIRASERTRLMASYYSERNLQEPDMLNVKPHFYAAAAVYAALKQQNTQFPDQLRTASCWPVRLQEESGLKESELVDFAKKMIRHVGEEPVTTSKRKLVACKKKYLNEKYLNIASAPLPVFEA